MVGGDFSILAGANRTVARARAVSARAFAARLRPRLRRGDARELSAGSSPPANFTIQLHAAQQPAHAVQLLQAGARIAQMLRARRRRAQLEQDR